MSPTAGSGRTKAGSNRTKAGSGQTKAGSGQTKAGKVRTYNVRTVYRHRFFLLTSMMNEIDVGEWKKKLVITIPDQNEVTKRLGVRTHKQVRRLYEEHKKELQHEAKQTKGTPAKATS